jgi:glycosyltransferase involved in cell wall biosynthesis
MRIDLTGMVRLRRVLLRLKPDILHCHGYYAALASLLLRLTGIRIPILYTVHAGMYRGSQRSDHLIQWVMRRCDQVTTVSHQTAASVRDFSNGTVHPIVVHNGVNLTRISVADNSARMQSRRTFGVEPDRLILMMVAALNKPKDHPTLFRAFAQALPKLGDVELWLVGDGLERRTLEKLSNDLGIAGRVRFWGKRNDVGNLLLATDVFVLASHSEGLPISVVEACCAGIPVVATDVGGLAHLRRLGLEILLTPIKDVGALRDSLLHFADPSHRNSLSERIAERARQLFSIERTAKEYLRLYVAIQLEARKEAAA